ncbi:MAG TPA: STAS domain-containing protein [Solirubrobacteraceae bacterium]|nr:STAS domain-containing protein [Solirubrobacteraceae bacterium]
MPSPFETPASRPPSAPAPAVWQREVDQTTCVIAVEGELDLSTAPRLKWMLLDALQGAYLQVALDLSLTTFMDSTALGVLVAVRRKLDPAQRLAIACPRADVLKIFEFAGVDAAFAIFPTLDEALADVRGHAAPAG